ncbi:MAG: carboxypeptidase-like regulatory domain-containing protein [Chitinophagales bacterium]|nr:carboxypeptidase-like regulatory domain-containing protein [Bacteroidota bacterium]
MRKFFAVLCLFLSGCAWISAKEVVQFSGFVREVETSTPIPFCAIYVQGENRGTISGYDGFFSFVAGKGDTVLIKSLGFKTFKIVIPSDLEMTSFSKDIALEKDYIQLGNVTIRPLPTPGQLRHAMLNLDIPDNLQDLAKNTIEQSILNDEISSKTNFDGKENFNQYVQSQANYYYNRYGNQHPGISLTNPFAWAQFIKDIKAKKKNKK